MKPRFSTLIIIGLAAAYCLSILPPKQIAAQDDRRGMLVQQATPTERRVALVIGNSAYKDSPLLNPVNDARDMAAALRGMGFEVIFGENLSQINMKRNIRAFGEKILNGGVGLFYYAGHGIQVRGSNFLIPVGATITSEEEVEYESVDLGLVLAQMETARNRLNIVILDACRNNPFARSFRSPQKGLASIDAPKGTLIAYATAPGSVASDGSGRNGLYTKELLKYMKQTELSIEQIFKQVRIAVLDQTRGKQIPWEASSLVGDFYFSSQAKSPMPPSDPATVELSFWESIKNSSDSNDFKAYLDKYPIGTFVVLAKNKIKNLETARNPGNTTPGSGADQSSTVFKGGIPNGSESTEPASQDNDLLVLQLVSSVSTDTSRIGDRIIAKVTAPSSYQGAFVEGHIASIKKPDGTIGIAKIEFAFDQLTMADKTTAPFAASIEKIVAARNVWIMGSQGKREPRKMFFDDVKLLGQNTAYVEEQYRLDLDSGTELIVRKINGTSRPTLKKRKEQ